MVYQLAKQRAALHQLPIPVYRGGSQKSPWLVDTAELANYLDKCKKQAKRDWLKINGDILCYIVAGGWAAYFCIQYYS